MHPVIKVAKKNKSTLSNDPNDYIFHSDFNTFKIIKEDTKTIILSASTNNQTFTEPHGINSFIPLAHAFARRDGIDQVFLPNGVDVETHSLKAGFAGDVDFNFVETDNTNVIFNFNNRKATTVTVYVRYFILEEV